MVKKLVPVIVVLLALGGAYKFVIAKPPAKAEAEAQGPRHRLHAPEGVPRQPARRAASRSSRSASILAHDDMSTVAAGGHGAAAPRPRATAPMTQEGVVRDVITDVLTDAEDNELIESKGRHHLKEEILKDIKKHTDVKVEHVIFSDITVQ